MLLFVVVMLACCNIMITCILTLFIIYQSHDRLQVLNRMPFLFTGSGVCIVMQNMTMESSGLIDPASARGQVMFLPGSTWVTNVGAGQPLSGRKEKKRRENWHGRGGGGCGCSIVIEQELLMLNAQAIIAKQPL